MHPVVQSIASDPSGVIPVEGQSWIVGSAANGLWSGHEQDIAGWTGGGWRFFTPSEAVAVFVEEEGCYARYHNGDWTVASTLNGASGGAVQDAEARSAIDSILAALRGAGIVI